MGYFGFETVTFVTVMYYGSSNTSNGTVAGCVCIPKTHEGYPYSLFIAHVFQDCVYTTRDYIGFSIGLASLLFWICAQTPQFIKNCKARNASALSIFFLAEWMTGDTMNLVSCLLTGQLSTVTITSILFVTMDFFLLGQYIMFETSCCKDKVPGEEQYDQVLLDETNAATSDDPLLGTVRKADYSTNSLPGHQKKVRSAEKTKSRTAFALFVPVLLFGMAGIFGGIQASDASDHGMALRLTERAGGRKLLNEPSAAIVSSGDGPLDLHFGAHKFHPNACNKPADKGKTIAELGVIMGWASALIYLSSRVPQILKNIKRGSVEGLSPIMFFCAVMGNTTYALGIIIRAENWNAVTKAAPYLVGSIGTLMFDFTILTQFWYYKDKAPRRPKRLDENQNPLSKADERGLHGIVRWDASPWMSPTEVRVARDREYKSTGMNYNYTASQ